MDLLSDILSHLQLSSALYFRTSFTHPWSIQVPAFANVSRFHFVHRGHCMVRIEAHKEPVHLQQGDLIIITRGASHKLFSNQSCENKVVQLDQVLQESGFNGEGTLVYGNKGADHETQLICGHFAFNDHARHPLLSALPSHIYIRDYGEDAGRWMESTLKIIGAEAGGNEMGSSLLTLKMSEIIYIQALRTFLSTEGKKHSALAGFSDTRIASALKAIHADPAHPWTLESLARHAGLSRTAFAIKFTRYLTMTPLSYITQWRMQIARRLLVESDQPIIDVAESTGYQSEASFGRIFKRHFDIAPATYRRQYRTRVID